MPKKKAAEEVETKPTVTEEPAAESKAVIDQAESEPEETKSEEKLKKAGPKSRKATAEREAEAKRKAKSKSTDKPERPEPVKQGPRVKFRGKKYRAAALKIEKGRHYELAEAIALAKETVTTKFDSTVELHINLGVDPRQADQMVRASLVLPAGSGKKLRVAVVVPAAKQAEAKTAGADLVGEQDLVAKIEKGKLDFDVLIATPDMMPVLGKVAKILGPKGLMPNPKSGTVTTDVTKAVSETKAGRVEFRIDSSAIVHQAIGKASFKADDLLVNAKSVLQAATKAKPAGAKGTYVKGITLTTSMGPAIRLDVQKALTAK
jgi:large subunit ribosomal protein L1